MDTISHGLAIQRRLSTWASDTLTASQIMALVRADARKHGISLRRLTPTNEMRCPVAANGTWCTISYATSLWQPRRAQRSYSRLQANRRVLEQVTALIFLQTYGLREHRVWVFPSDLLLAHMEGRNRHVFYVPCERAPLYHNITPAIDWWKYASGWPLLFR